MEIAERMKLEEEIITKQHEVQRIQEEVQAKNDETRRLQEEIDENKRKKVHIFKDWSVLWCISFNGYWINHNYYDYFRKKLFWPIIRQIISTLEKKAMKLKATVPKKNWLMAMAETWSVPMTILLIP